MAAQEADNSVESQLTSSLTKDNVLKVLNSLRRYQCVDSDKLTVKNIEYVLRFLPAFGRADQTEIEKMTELKKELDELDQLEDMFLDPCFANTIFDSINSPEAVWVWSHSDLVKIFQTFLNFVTENKEYWDPIVTDNFFISKVVSKLVNKDFEGAKVVKQMDEKEEPVFQLLMKLIFNSDELKIYQKVRCLDLLLDIDLTEDKIALIKDELLSFADLIETNNSRNAKLLLEALLTRNQKKLNWEMKETEKSKDDKEQGVEVEDKIGADKGTDEKKDDE